MRVIDVREQSKFDWFNQLYFHCDWSKFDKLSCEINFRNAPWIKNSKTWRFGSYIPTYCSKTWLQRNVFQSQNLHL